MSVQQEDRFADLKAKLDQPRAESYKFTRAGEILTGTVAKLDVGRTRDGDQVRIVVLDDGEALRSVWLLHDALDSQMRKLKPQPGDRIAIRYNGKETSAGSGRQYHSYTVVSDREQPAFSWDDEVTGSAGGDESPRFTADPWASDPGEYPQEPNPFHDDPPF